MTTAASAMTMAKVSRPRTSAFSDWLRRELKVRRMTQRQLAVRSGIDHSTISRLVTNDRNPSLGTVLSLSRALGGLPPDAADWRQHSQRHPVTHVEHALRGDDRLGERDVRQLMTQYLALRGSNGE